jgi:hypothetical protein
VWRNLRYPVGMSRAPKEARPDRRPATTRGLIREVSYLHPDEEEALVKQAEQKRCSKAEIIRRALRAYLGIED